MIELEKIQQTLIDHGYEYKQTIGQGGFSYVFLCHSLKYNYDFAVKMTTKDNSLTYDEYSTLISLNHPHIIKLYDAFEDDFAQYLVMEYCQKGTIIQKKEIEL